MSIRSSRVKLLGVVGFLSAAALAAPVATAADVPATMPSTAPTTGATASVGSIDDLVAQLGADDWKARQSAEDALVKLGPAARPRLAGLAASSTSSETRTRAASAVARIDQADLGAPTLISLHLASAPPKLVFAEIARQARIDLPARPDDLWDQQSYHLNPITLDADHQPFWPVVLDACAQAGVCTRGEGQSEITLAQGEQLSGARYVGPDARFTVLATNVCRNRSIPLDTRALQRDDRISFALLIDPKVRLIAYDPHVTIDRGDDDKGHPVVAPLAAANALASGPEQMTHPDMGWMTRFDLPLVYPDDGATKIPVLRGSLQVLVPTKVERVAFDDLQKAANASQTVGGRTVTIQNATANGEQLSVSMQITRAGCDKETWANNWNDLRDVKLVFPNGKTVGNCFGGGSVSDKVLNYQFTFTYPDGPKVPTPIKLVWDVPTETKILSVPFEYHDLPLPPP